MSNFTLTLRKEYDFDGDKVIVKMTRLTRPNALLIMPHVQKIADSEGASMDLNATMNFMEAASKVLRDSIKEISGLFIEGEEIKAKSPQYEVMLESVYFLNLIISIVNDLVTESFIKDVDEKKPEE